MQLTLRSKRIGGRLQRSGESFSCEFPLIRRPEGSLWEEKP